MATVITTHLQSLHKFAYDALLSGSCYVDDTFYGTRALDLTSQYFVYMVILHGLVCSSHCPIRQQKGKNGGGGGGGN